MKKELVWNVYIHDVNHNRITPYNIFQHSSFCKYLYKAKVKYLKKDSFDFDTFMEEVKKELMCYFWSKCEWGIIIKAWAVSKVEEKVDVCGQIMMNWEAFKEYLYNNYKYIKK